MFQVSCGLDLLTCVSIDWKCLWVYPNVWISCRIWKVGVMKSCGSVVVSWIFMSSVLIAASFIEM